MALKELAYLAGATARLPGWIKVLLYLLVSALAVAVAGYWGVRMMILAAVVMAVLGLVLLGYVFLAHWVRERKAAELRGDLEPRPVGDSDSGLRRDAVRESFSRGLETFQMAGKDIYELPWFVVLGESQAGKTQAIRHAGIEIPLTTSGPEPTAAQPLTWWFTNYAVLIEVSGGVVFGESDQGVRPEWLELLTLLKKHRRTCPLNGFLLVLPADRLQNDPPRELEQKAGALARHFDAAQRVLGVLAPVCVLVTKADRIEGFTPFFAGFTDPAQSRQILGWSNPAALEAPFRPEIFDDYLRVLAQRLKRRRLAVLADPVPRQSGGRRIDEVDELFALPQNLQNLVPRVRRYLENIFVAGEWTARPQFLRGVYFASADPVAETAPLGLDEGPASSRFLRDVFLDKMFREDGLVVDSDPDRPAKVRRRMLLFSAGVIAILALFLVAVDHYRKLIRSQQAQAHYWARGAEGWKNNTWSPLVTRDRDGKFVYHGDNSIGLPKSTRKPRADAALTLVEFHQALANLSSVPLPVPWIYQPLSWVGISPDTSRYEAQKVLFEASVVRPLLTATREKMTVGEIGGQWILPAITDDASLTREAKALTELIRVEAAVAGRAAGRDFPNPGDTFLPALQEYLTGTPADRRLVAVMNWTYGKNPEGRKQWAPEWTSGGITLETNDAIRAGLDRLVEFANHSVDHIGSNLALLQRLGEAASRYAAAETDLAKAASIQSDWTASDQAMANAFEGLEAAKIQMESRLLEVRSAGLFEDGPETLSAALSRLSTGTESRLGQVNVILAEIQSILPPPVKDPGGPESAPLPDKDPRYKLLRQIQKRLVSVADLINQKTQNADIAKLEESFQTLDRNVLEAYEGVPSYLWRWRSYQSCAAASPADHFRSDMYLVGQGWSQLSALCTALDDLQGSADAYTGGQAQAYLTICNYFLQRARTVQTSEFVAGYVGQARQALLRVLRFPLVWPPGPDNEALDASQLKGAQQLLQAIASDLQNETFTQLPVSVRQPVADFARRILPLYSVAGALIKPDGTLIKVSVTLYNGPAQKQLSGPNFTPLPVPTPTPTPPPRSLMSKLFTGAPKPSPTPFAGPTLNVANWNAVALLGGGTGAVYPLDSPTEVLLGLFSVQDGFSFEVYHSLIASDGTDLVDGGKNWSALRLIARFGGKPVGVGQDWQVPLKPNEPNAVWIKFSFEQALPTTPWPTLDSLGLRQPFADPSGAAPTGP